MKKVLLRSVVVLMALHITGCSAVDIISENPRSPKLSRYNRIFVAWLDLGVGNWKTFGYKSAGEWSNCIREINKDWFQAELKGQLSSKKLVLAAGPGTGGAGDLGIFFSRTYMERHWVGGFGGYDYIFTTVTFKDLRSGRIVYSGKICSSSKGMGPQQWRFEGRMGFAARNIAYYIGSKF